MTLTTEEIWESFAGDLRRFILRRLDDPQDAEDILQEVFIKIHTHLDTLQDTDRLLPWLYQVTRNSIVDYYRKRRPVADLPETLAIEPETETLPVENGLASGLRTMMECLPEKYRQALLLTELEGVKQVDLAPQLGLTVSGMKSRVQRGRDLLRQAFFDCCHFQFDLRGAVLDYTPRQTCCRSCKAHP